MKVFLVTLALGICPLILLGDTLPPEKSRAPWSELKNFAKWQIKEFKGWAVPFDGGSKVFFFQTTSGDHFDVMAANPAYWTAEDKKNRKQVFFVIRKDQFYRLESGSDQETALIKMIEEARPGLSGKERTDPKILDSLVERIRSRAPMF